MNAAKPTPEIPTLRAPSSGPTAGCSSALFLRWHPIPSWPWPRVPLGLRVFLFGFLAPCGFSPAIALEEDTVIAPASSRPPAAADQPLAYDPIQRSLYLVLLLATLAGAAWWYCKVRPQRQPQTATTPNLRILEIRSLGQRQYLAIAACGDEKFLLGICPGQITLLTKLGQPEFPDKQ